MNRRRVLAPPGRLALVNRRRRWVLQLWEAFLIQMDDFDSFLEFQLRRRLDALMAAPVPIRRGRAGVGDSAKRRSDEQTATSVTDLGDLLVLPF